MALFDGSCLRCAVDVDAAVSVLGIDMRADFSGSLTPAPAATIRVAQQGWLQQGGAFVGGAASVVVTDGTLALLGGLFRAPTSTLAIYPARPGQTVVSVAPDAGFEHNGGRVAIMFRFSGNNYSTFAVAAPANLTLHDLDIRPGLPHYTSGTVVLRQPLELEGSLWAGTTALSGAPLTVRGSIDFSRQRTNAGGPTRNDIILAGAALQTITSGPRRLTNGTLSIVDGATVELANDLRVDTAAGELTVTRGTLYLRGHDATVGNALHLGPSSVILREGGTLTVGGSPVADGPFEQGEIIP